MNTNHPPMPAMAAGFGIIAFAACLIAAFGIARGQGSIAPGELVAPKIEISGGNVHFTVQPSVNGRKYQLHASETQEACTWQDLGSVVTGDGNNLVMTTPHIPGTPRRFYRLALDATSLNTLLLRTNWKDGPSGRPKAVARAMSRPGFTS